MVRAPIVVSGFPGCGVEAGKLQMVKRIMLTAALIGVVGCATGSVHERFPCPEETLADWQISAGWIVRELTPTQARVEVSTANIAKDAAESRWQLLQSRRRDGDRFWLYRRPENDTIDAMGAQEGVVLIRGCEQVGFVTTRLAAETDQPTRP